jgi:transcription initiation factor TFIIB
LTPKKQDKDKQKIEYTKKCPECGSKNISKDDKRGEVVCQECGLVLDEDIIDHGPEWRAFDAEQKKKRARAGPPTKYTLHDKGLSTTIGWKNRDSYGRTIPTKMRGQIYRLRKWQRRTRISNASERSLAVAFAELNKIASILNLPRTIREQAGMLYRKAAKKNLIRGRSVEGVVIASVYAACRLAGMPRTLDELADKSQIKRKEIGRTYRFLVRELGLKMPPSSPVDYVSRFGSKLGLDQDVKTKTVEILEQAIESELTSGRGPVSLAAAAIYIASVLCGKRVTQREIAEVAGVTEVTIRNRYKELAEKLDIDITI